MMPPVTRRKLTRMDILRANHLLRTHGFDLAMRVVSFSALNDQLFYENLKEQEQNL